MRNGQVIKTVGLGAGGHAKVVIEMLRLMGNVELVGLLDVKESLWQTKVLGVPILGGDGLLPELVARGVRQFFIGLGSTGEFRPRRRLYDLARSYGLEPTHVLHRDAVISSSAQIGLGPTIMAGVLINAEARIGENVIINTGAIVEHDCVIGDNVHIATGARLAGAVFVDDGTHIGIGAVVRESLRIGKNVLVGAGAVVVNDVPDHVVVAGVPARVVRRRDV